jgi:hypothetical protein
MTYFDDSQPPKIQLHIGKIPVLVAGNSDGDIQMVEYASDNNWFIMMILNENIHTIRE